jgi:acetyl esterase/lipase
MEITARIDPELLPGLEAMQVMRLPRTRDEVAAAREVFAQLMAAASAQAPVDDRVTQADHDVPGRDEVFVRLYRPAGVERTLPALYWIHGGGMVLGTVDSDDVYCRRLVTDLGIAVVSVQYRLAPEHPFPVPLEDCYAGLALAAERAAELGIDPDRLAVGGASAGGGLAAGTVLAARDRGGPALTFQYLMYPMIDDRSATPSSREFTGVASWSTEHNVNGWDCYLGPDRAEVSPYAAPARADDLRGLPPTLIQVGELEVFRDEDIDYAQRLLQAGVACELHVYPGAYHGWDMFNPGAALTERALADRNDALRRGLKLD